MVRLFWKARLGPEGGRSKGISILVSEKGSPGRPSRAGLCRRGLALAAGDGGMGVGAGGFHSSPERRAAAKFLRRDFEANDGEEAEGNWFGSRGGEMRGWVQELVSVRP